MNIGSITKLTLKTTLAGDPNWKTTSRRIKCEMLSLLTATIYIMPRKPRLVVITITFEDGWQRREKRLVTMYLTPASRPEILVNTYAISEPCATSTNLPFFQQEKKIHLYDGIYSSYMMLGRTRSVSIDPASRKDGTLHHLTVLSLKNRPK